MPKRISLTRGKFAVVDDDDFEKQNSKKWSAHYDSKIDRWYAIRSIWGKGTGKSERLVYMHREIAKTIKGFEPHHKNGDGLDNRKKNLVNLTRSQHMRIEYKTKLRADNKSGVNGVYWWPRDQNWKVAIRVDGKAKTVGYFDTLEQAANARRKAEKLYWGL